jgi:outer membrane lipopolysaccharide assembly protein LptE/RlpB
MIKKFTFLLIIIFTTTNCGFTPIYSNKNINNIYIEKLKFDGDRTLNNYLKSNLSRYKNDSSPKKISLEVLTDYQKITLSKDSTGKTSKYTLVAKVTFTIMPNNQIIILTQKKIMENMNNKAGEKDFETSAKQSFANIMVDNLILKLVEIK